MIAEMRKICEEYTQQLSRMAVDETKMGRYDDKVRKNLLAIRMTPGVEDLQPVSYTDDHGLTLVERAPYGVIGAIAPSTNPTETIVNNGIAMIAAGNTIVFAPHPAARVVSAFLVGLLNKAITRVGGPENVITTISEPSIEAAKTLMNHPYIALLTVTGGPGVVREAMKSDKKVIAAVPVLLTKPRIFRKPPGTLCWGPVLITT
jgi:acyl-CoA reductase-like NAD-dependent aldehyde dehydrogenase